MGDEPPGYVLFQVQLPHFHCRMDSCSSLEESRVSLTWSLAFVIFPPLSLPPPSHHRFLLFSPSELIITSGGENIPPVPIESMIKSQIPFLSNVMVVGDKKKFLTCLMTLKVHQPHPHTNTTVAWYLYLSPKYYYAFPLAPGLNPSSLFPPASGLNPSSPLPPGIRP